MQIAQKVNCRSPFNPDLGVISQPSQGILGFASHHRQGHPMDLRQYLHSLEALIIRPFYRHQPAHVVVPPVLETGRGPVLRWLVADHL